MEHSALSPSATNALARAVAVEPIEIEVGLQSQFVRGGEAFGFDAYNFIAGTRSSFGELGLMPPLRSRGFSGRIVARDGGRSGPSSHLRGADVGSIV